MLLPTARSATAIALAFLLLAASVVHAAVNLDGTQAVGAVTEDDPSPINSINTYYPDRHDCPLPCVDYANTHSWITYFSVRRLERCQEPMLLDFSATQPLDDPAQPTMIRACTLATDDSKANRALVLQSQSLWGRIPRNLASFTDRDSSLRRPAPPRPPSKG